MKYIELKKDLKVSNIVMGCMRIADKPLAQIEQTVALAFNAGVNMFDLADVYADGEAEKTFGQVMRDLGIDRKEYVLQSKCGIRKDGRGKINRFDFSKKYILKAVENSLSRLGTDYLDVLLLHRPDTLVEPDEVAEAFEKLRKTGKVRAFGVSNFSAMQMQLFQNAGIEIVANQMQFSLGHTAPVDSGFNVNMNKDESVCRAGESMEYCRLHHIAMQSWSPLQYGFFEGLFVGNDKFPKLNAQLNKIAEKYGVSPSTIAVAWVLRHPAFKQVVTGTTSMNHMAEMCDAGDIILTRDEWYSLYAATGKVLP